MSDIFNSQQEMMKNIQDFIEQEKEKLNTIYSECITKMNEDNPNKQIYDDIDELLLSTNSKAKDFYSQFDSDNLEIIYWYDINKKQFINKLDNYNNKIIKKCNFEIYTVSHLLHRNSVRNKINMPLKYIEIYHNTNNVENKFNGSYVIPNEINEFQEDQIISSLHIGSIKDIKLNIKCKNMRKCKNMKIYIDDYLNIFFPEINTIIINNYTKFSLNILYSISNYLNLSNITILNVYNSEDSYVYNVISSIIHPHYLTSQEHRNRFNDGKLFQDILDFINYNDMILDVKKYLDFASKLRVYGKEDDNIKKELESKNKVIEDKDKEIERLKLELEELKKFYINS